MLRSDFRIICTALGFMAVVQKEGLSETDRASKAIALAQLIEDFCHTNVPEVLENEK